LDLRCFPFLYIGGLATLLERHGITAILFVDELDDGVNVALLTV